MKFVPATCWIGDPLFPVDEPATKNSPGANRCNRLAGPARTVKNPDAGEVEAVQVVPASVTFKSTARTVACDCGAKFDYSCWVIKQTEDKIFTKIELYPMREDRRMWTDTVAQ